VILAQNGTLSMLLDSGSAASRLDDPGFAGVCPIAGFRDESGFAGVCPAASRLDEPVL
jgi:hypothetical protein